MAYHLGVVGKPYSDGELVKRCLIDVVKYIHSGKEADYFSIALSRVTMQRRQDDIAEQLKLSLQAKISKKESLFSLAADESTDIDDSAQLLIFDRCLSSSFELCEDFLSMETVATRTHGEDIYIAVKNACIRSGLDLKYLHCIIHQKALCAKSVALNTILKDVNRIILFICANALHHQQFREISCSSKTSAEDILYHSTVRWLSIGETCAIAKGNSGILFNHKQGGPLLDKDFLMSLGFLVDFLTQVNFLNQSTYFAKIRWKEI